jgi:hypothetical protein
LRKYLSIIFVSLFLFHSISASAAEKIVILPFESLAKEDISFIQGVIPKLLSSRLSDMTGWEAVSVEATTADETVKKYGPVYLVSGSVTKLGETYSLDIILRDPAGEKVGGYFSMAKDENGILASLEGLAKDVVKSLPGIESAEEEVAQAKGEAETAVTKEQLEGASPLPAEGEKSAQQREVAALKPEAVPVKKESFSEIKKVKTLGKLPGEIYRVASADIDGDGFVEIAFMGKHKIFLYRFKNGQIHPIKTVEKKNDHHFLNVDVYDVDNDGLIDFVVTDLVSEFLRSFVIGKKDDRIGIKIEGVSWYLAVFDDFRGQKVLVGQKLGFHSPYSDTAYILSWDGRELKEGEKFSVPTNEELVMGVLSMNAFRDGEKQRFVLIDQYDKIRTADSQGRIFWKSGDYYSGALDFFEIPSQNIGADGMLRRHYVNSRLKKMARGNKIMFLIREAPKPLTRDRKAYSKSKLVLVEWDGDGFSKIIEGDEVPNLITDFSIFETERDKFMIVTPVIVSKEAAFSKGMTKVELFAIE